MSRVRRLLLLTDPSSSLASRRLAGIVLEQSDFADLLDQPGAQPPAKQYLLLTAWVFLPGLVAVGHPIIFPPSPYRPPRRGVESIKGKLTLKFSP